jgi:hypothetical protein
MAAPLRSFTKDPESTLDYPIDWSQWLVGADTITGAPVWTVPSGLTLVTQANTATIATAWISGGTAGATYLVECKITTTGGRIDERSILVEVKEQ